MASNERFWADHTTMDGDRWMVAVVDTDYTGVGTEVNVGMDSFDIFTLNYDGAGLERFNPVMASKCTVNISVLASYQSAFETFIDDLVNADEGRFFLVIYKHNGSSWDFHWRGMILQDLINEEDIAVPYVFQLQATDGIGRLKDIDMPVDLLSDDTYYTFIDLLILILNKTGTKDLWGSAENYLRTAIDWYEESMYTTAPGDDLDPLLVSRVLSNAFHDYNFDNDFEIMNCWDGLDNICRLWGARILLVDGVWNIVQINNYSNTDFVWRNYYKDGTANSYDAGNDYTTSDHNRTGAYQYYPVLSKVQLNYNYKQSLNPYYSLLPDRDQYETSVSFGLIQAGNDEMLLFTGVVEMQMAIGDPSPSSDAHRWTFEMMIYIGSYYLTNKNGPLEWSTTTTDRVTYKSGYFLELKSYLRRMSISFMTPAIPASGTGYFKFTHTGFEDENGDAWTVDPLNTATYKCIDFWLRLKINDNLDNGTVEFYAENISGGTLVAASSILQLPDINMGDGPDDHTDGAIQVHDGVAWANSDEEWTVGGDTIGYNINELCCIEVLAGQRSAQKKFMGNLFGPDITALTVITIDSVKYVFLGGTFKANDRMWDGEWFEMSVTRANINSDFEKKKDGKLTDFYRRLSTDDANEQTEDKVSRLQRAVVGDVRLYYDASTGLVKIQTSTDNGVTWSDSGTEWEL